MEKQFGRDSYDTGRKKLQGKNKMLFLSFFFTKEMRERFKEQKIPLEN